jgi:hypothetical protein
VKPARLRAPVTFGSADGLTVLLGLLVSLSGDPHALWRAALGAGLAELVGMSAGAWLSDEKAGITPAVANGAASLTACVLPALPYLVTSGTTALAMSVAVVVALGCGISVLRPERGFLAFVTTFSILAGAALLCWAASFM